MPVRNYTGDRNQMAHRDQVMLTIDLDEIAEMFKELCDAVSHNARRYTTLFAEVFQEMLPNYKTQEMNMLK
ncbi:hypothetical protein CDAR_295161 [Caerostris darwini]|uniref:MCM N-terminal domain-containing protein n=1 Tax=Caerostris darwini TaxID=1538125 RepID=A0AAV4SIB8_9ARAC|nr:hypothetical protein CDAR_295161 [Caerostris darwini]